jgi:hypothetical protein
MLKSNISPDGCANHSGQLEYELAGRIDEFAECRSKLELRELLGQPVECLIQALVCEILAQGLMMKFVKRAFQSASVANRSAAIVTSETILAEGEDG